MGVGPHSFAKKNRTFVKMQFDYHTIDFSPPQRGAHAQITYPTLLTDHLHIWTPLVEGFEGDLGKIGFWVQGRESHGVRCVPPQSGLSEPGGKGGRLVNTDPPLKFGMGPSVSGGPKEKKGTKIHATGRLFSLVRYAGSVQQLI